MKHAAMLAVAVLLGLGSLGRAQEPQRVLVVRDDDGSADAGRGHVSNTASVCCKTLELQLDPVTVTQARIMYYMKVNPYDVGTRKLYGAPVEGVRWSNLVVTLNGREVLRDSLIKHGTQGWHEVAVEPALLRRGENTITMALDVPGSYFYLGIDRSAPRGRSASSTDSGKTFRPGWLSFGTKEADPGEYMVRLKLWTAVTPDVGFAEHEGHRRGWLEVEDLFSTTRVHASGFKALPWDRGVNAPSRGLTAWGMAGSFEFPLHLPAEGEWRLWLRGWMDGFRGGAFTLSWDGTPFYSSHGKHEFTSDAQLRFDWLDLGAVSLSEGRHMLGVEATGNCGHMFDVLVLTTDPAYRPDAGAPLPRMTGVESLVPPEGLASLSPGLYMTENPIPWARPLAGGPLRTLWVCSGINEREVVELQARMDMTADVVSSDISYYGSSIFGSDLNMDQGDLLYDLLVSEKPYDVTVLVRTRLDQVPDHAMTELLRRVREGMGLVVVRSRRKDEEKTKLSALLEDTKPLDLPAFRAPFSLKNQAGVSWREYGSGRILRRSYSLWGTFDHLGLDPEERRLPFWEYQFGHWVNLLQRAGGRGEARLTALEVPNTVQPGVAAEMVVGTTGKGAAQLVGCVWGPNRTGWRRWGPVPCSDRTAVELPADIEHGLYHVQVGLLDTRGEVSDCGVTSFRVRQAAHIADMQVAYGAGGGGRAEIGLQTANDGAAIRLPARVDVFGSRRRLLGTAQAALEFAEGEGEARLTVPLLPSWERLLEVRLSLGPVPEAPLQRVRRFLPRPQAVALDDYLSFTGTHTNQEAPTYCWPAYARLYDDVGIKVHYPNSILWASLDQGFASGLAYRLTGVGSARTGPDSARIPCLHDPQTWAREEEAIRQRVRQFTAFSPLILGLGDEMAVSHHDEVCFSTHTLAAFREHLQSRYGALQRLNAAWQTQFADWETVAPWKVDQARGRPENIAPWLEFRVFMTQALVDALVRMQRWVKEEAPTAYTGGANPLDESYTSCAVLSRIYPSLEYAQVYARFHDRARSWFRDPRLVGMWSGYNYPRAMIEQHAWMLPTYGGTLMCWYGVGRELDYRTFTNTLGLGDRALVIRDCNLELQAGIGKLLIAAEVEPEPVAILSSYRSKFAYTALKASQAPKQSPTGWDREFDEFLQGYSALLRKLRVPYRFVNEDQIEQGALNDCHLVVAPQASVLSQAAVDRLTAFAREHPLVADQELGTYDERGRRRGTAPFSFSEPGDLRLTDFGGRPPRVTEDSLGRLGHVVEAAGVEPTGEMTGTGIDFIVRKRLGDLRLLVAFGEGEMTVAPPPGTVAYDARTHASLGARRTTVAPKGGPAVVVFAPAQLTDITLTARADVSRGQQVEFGMRIRPAVDTVVRLAVTGPDGGGRSWYDANVTVTNGRGRATFRPALNDPVGQWTFVATDIISGTNSTTTLRVVE